MTTITIKITKEGSMFCGRCPQLDIEETGESEALVLSYVGGRLECLGTNFHWNNNGKLELE